VVNLKTLLDLFFKPYLMFLLKFNLIAIAAFVVIVVSGIQEVITIAPFMYFFGLYSTSNRHQFKDNISWMMASFSKKTLMGYHLLSQTMILVLQVVLSGVVTVGFLSSVIFFIPEATDVMPKAVGVLTSPEIQDSLINTTSSYFSRKEILVSLIAFIFFLITMYSPISMKDYLKSMEEKKSQGKYTTRLISIGTLILGVIIIGGDVDLKDYLLLILSSIVVGELCYIAFIYNKVFILLHPRHYAKAAVLASVFLVAFTSLNYSKSLSYFQSGASQEGRLQELMFLGVLAPKLDKSYFENEFKDLNNAKLLVQFLRNKRYKPLISTELIAAHVLKASDFAIAVDLFGALGEEKAGLLAKAEIWGHLNQLFMELHKKNQASAFWVVRSFAKEVSSSKWKPQQEGDLSSLSVLEQMQTLAWYQKHDSKAYGALLSKGLDPKVEEMFLGKERKPASSDL
jgi:hypothetical protein